MQQIAVDERHFRIVRPRAHQRLDLARRLFDPLLLDELDRSARADAARAHLAASSASAQLTAHSDSDS